MCTRSIAAVLVTLLVGCQGTLYSDLPPPPDEDPLPEKDPPLDAGMPHGDAGPEWDGCGGLDFFGRCDGDVVTWCGRDGTLQTRDCGATGLVCAWKDADSGHWCLRPTAPPAPIEPPGPIPEDAGPGSDGASDSGGPGPDAGASAPPPAVGMPSCRTWGDQHTASDGSWGGTLTDIVRHLPTSYGSTYYDADHVTYGHETSHGIHSHIRNYLNDTGDRANGFYVPGGQACLVREPMMRKSDVAAYIPSNLQGSRYSLYISGSTAWDDTPLYVWDEWNAYVNGAEVGLDRSREGLWTSGWRGTVDGVIEFVVYGVAVGMAAEAREPGYFEREPNFLAFLAFELERSMAAFHAGQADPLMSWETQDEYAGRLRSSGEAAGMRDWIRSRFGAAWTLRVMGF